MIRKRGFSLLEIMIALSIGLLVFLGMFEVFNAARQGYRYTQGLATIQENGQLASYILTHELSQTGYVGCRKLDNAFVVASHGESNIGLTTLIHGYTQRTLPSTQKIIAKSMLSDSSVVAIQFMDATTDSLLKPVTDAASWLVINSISTLKPGNQVLIADCQHADLVRVTAVTTSAIETNVQVHVYTAGAQIGKWHDEWFYVANTGRVNEAGRPVTALYVHQPNDHDEELVDNVTNMHVKYGYLTTTGQLQFVTASQVPDWSAIKVVDVKLLLNSDESILSQPQVISFDDSNWRSTDRQLYRQWEVIVGLMNR